MSSSRKIAFVLTSTGNDIFCGMTRVAIESLRQTNPDISIVVVCDTVTNQNIRLQKNPILDEVDSWLSYSTPDAAASIRNRYLKTRLRSLLAGKFLFLDSDVLVRGDLSHVFDIREDIAGARNHSQPHFDSQIGPVDVSAAAKLGWAIKNTSYINGGVFFYNDTPGAHEFGEKWHKSWLYTSRTLGQHRDQVALNHSIEQSSASFKLLPDKLNAQLWGNPSVIVDASIWHYYSSSLDAQETPFLSESIRVSATGELRRQIVADMIGSSYPWEIKHWFDNYLIKSAIKNSSIRGWKWELILFGFKEAALRFIYRKAGLNK